MCVVGNRSARSGLFRLFDAARGGAAAAGTFGDGDLDGFGGRGASRRAASPRAPEGRAAAAQGASATGAPATGRAAAIAGARSNASTARSRGAAGADAGSCDASARGGASQTGPSKAHATETGAAKASNAPQAAAASQAPAGDCSCGGDGARSLDSQRLGQRGGRLPVLPRRGALSAIQGRPAAKALGDRGHLHLRRRRHRHQEFRLPDPRSGGQVARRQLRGSCGSGDALGLNQLHPTLTS